LGDKKGIFGHKKLDGHLIYYLTFSEDEHWSQTIGLDWNESSMKVKDVLKAKFSDWNSVYHSLIDSTTVPFIPRPVYGTPLDQQWKTQNNITVIGDAAHVMPPFAGEGANMAMLDSLELTQFLHSSNHSTLQHALSTFENSMLKRTSKIAAETKATENRMFNVEKAEELLYEFYGRWAFLSRLFPPIANGLNKITDLLKFTK